MLLPVDTSTPFPSEAMPPAGQMPSPTPLVAHAPVMVGFAVLMATTQPWYVLQSPTWPPYATYRTPPTSDRALRWFCGMVLKASVPMVRADTLTGHPGRSLPSSTDSAWTSWRVIDAVPIAPAT